MSDKLSSNLDEEIFNHHRILENIYNLDIIDHEAIKNLEENTLPFLVDLIRLKENALRDLLVRNYSHPLLACLYKIYLYKDGGGLLEKISNIIRKPDLFQNWEANSFIQSIHSFMTTSQIENFLTLIPENFLNDYMINELLNRKFRTRLSKAKDHFQKRSILLEIKEFLSDKPLKYSSLKSDNLLHILENGVKTNIYDLSLFKEYLENPIDTNIYQYKLNPEKVVQLNQANSCRQNICEIQNKTISEEKSIIQKYLKHFFIFESLSFDVFSPYLQTDYLLKEYYNSLVLRGEEDDKLIKFLSNSVYEAIVKSVDIRICEHNNEIFGVDDNVEITVDIKNVQTLFIKIFEINTENYYFNKKETINSALSLEGLIATYEETYSFSDKPQKLVRRNFKFDKIPHKRGIFIIEFIGNGYSSRAIIKKGSLSMISRSTPNGKILYILDEQQNICKSERTGIWVKNEFYKSNQQSGAIIIPYQKSYSCEKAILVDDEFAEISEISLELEEYRLDASFIYNRESFLMGNVSKVLIKPFLFVNNILTDLKHLNNIKVTVNLTKLENSQEEIPITIVFENSNLFKEKLLNHEEIEVEFQIPPKLINITITLNAEVINKSQDIKIPLISSKSIKVDNKMDPYNSENSTNHFKIFLRKFEKNYYATVLCKNGEPQQNIEIKFRFKHSFIKLNHTNTILKTNDKGEVCLGRLENVQLINAESNCIGGYLKETFLIKSGNYVGYPKNLDILEGEELKFPIQDEDLTTLNLISLNNGQVIENFTHLLRIEAYHTETDLNSEVNKYKTVSVKDLIAGSYCISIGENQININVHQGKYWQSQEYIITETNIIQNSSNKQPIHLSKFQVNNLFSDVNEKNIENSSLQTIKMKLNSASTNARVHLFAYKFVGNLEGYSALNISRIFSQGNLFNNHYFQLWKNMYLSNRLLNEEIQYVLDRKYYERFMGNSLDKPSLLVKRQFIRDTTTDIQEAKDGTNYDRINAKMQMARDRPYLADSCLMKSGLYGGIQQDLQDVSAISEILHCNTSTFHNFLANSPLILTNLKPDINDEICINTDLSNYSVLHALVIDVNGAYEDSLYLPFVDIAKRDLRMTESLNPEQNFSEIRKTSLIHKGESHTITDITSTKYQVIDSIEKFLSYFMLSSRFNNLQKDFNDLKFLIKFDQLDDQEKHKKWSEYFSHEVNIFFFFKHHEFFLKNIRPVLRYKSEKTFIDFFLLGDINKIKEFSTTNRISSLNSFEKCLLIYALRTENPELVKTIAKNLRNEADINKISPDEMKRLFNIIINMRMEKEIPKVKESNFQQSAMMMGDFGGVMFSAAPMMNLCAKESMPRMKKMAVQRSVEKMAMFDVPFEEVETANLKANLTKEGGKSKEYCETHYYKSTTKEFKNLIPANGFYADLAEFWANQKDSLSNTSEDTLYPSKGFISSNIILPIINIPQLITTIATLDLTSTQSASHKFNRLEGRGLEILADSNMIVFTKEISETTADIKPSLMIAQMTNKKNGTELNNEDEILKEISEGMDVESDKKQQQYLINEVYKHETIVTNVSNKALTFELLINIPEGAIPVQGSDYTSTINLTLNKFKTSKIETFFYFPKAGNFIQYPPSASIEGLVIAKTQPLSYEVKETVNKLSHSTLDDVLESGTKKEIIEFLNRQDNLSSESLSKIYWLLNDQEFYNDLIKILKSKGIYDNIIWSFSFKHKDETTLKEYLEANSGLKEIIGPKSDFSLLKVDNHNNFNVMNHLDYHPILNSRVHILGQNKSSKILNKEFRNTYENFINYLLTLKEIDSKNYLRLCYYLILQDRIDEAWKIFQRIESKPSDILDSFTLQYDYIQAYIDFSLGYPEYNVAREICKKYKEFPLKHWRELFEEIEDQLLELDGKLSFDDADILIDEEKKKKYTSKVASETEPKLSFTIENKNLNILYNNIQSITIKFYLIDLEILFSRTPFIQHNSDDFSFVQPNFIQINSVELASKDNILTFPIPNKYINSNLFIEVSSSSKKAFSTHFSTSLVVNVSESMGEVKILDNNLKPLTKVYVKCYGMYKDESVKFYKDGYTDPRGRFNYISLNTDSVNSIKKFSIFIMHDDLGSLIKEVNPPPNMESIAHNIDDNNYNAYDKYMNYRQEIKQSLKSKKKE